MISRLNYTDSPDLLSQNYKENLNKYYFTNIYGLHSMCITSGL